MTGRNDRWGAPSQLYNNEHPLFFLPVYQEKHQLSLPSYGTNWQLLPISSYRTDWQPLPISSTYKYKSWPLPVYPVYKHQRHLGLDKNTMRKSMLDYPVDVKPLLHKESNKPNILQKLDFIPTHEPNQ